jgi:hypothetical protein
MSRYILNEVETSHHLILIRLYFILTILITEDDHSHIVFDWIKISNMTKFYCPNKSIYYFFKINTKISTSFRRAMLKSFWIDVPGVDPGGRAHPVRSPLPPKIVKNMIFLRKIVIFHTKYPIIFGPPSARRNYFKCTPPTWNPGSAPIDLNMYIINVIADDESKIGLYEIYFLNN